MAPIAPRTHQRWLARYACLVAAATLVLIFAGGLVTSTGSGLAVPDWPLSYGMLFPPMVGGILYEHGHRIVAGTVALLMAVLCACIWKFERRRVVRRVALIAMGAVLLLMTPLFVWSALHPLPFDVTGYSKSIDYEFRDPVYALEFALLNGARVRD